MAQVDWNSQVTLQDLAKAVQKEDSSLESLPMAYLVGAIKALLAGVKGKEEQLQESVALGSEIAGGKTWWTSERLQALDKLCLIRRYPVTEALKSRAGQLAKVFCPSAEVRYNRTGRWLRAITIKGQFAPLPAEFGLGPVKVALTGGGKTILLVDIGE